jgi:hypothetical protein
LDKILDAEFQYPLDGLGICLVEHEGVLTVPPIASRSDWSAGNMFGVFGLDGYFFCEGRDISPQQLEPFERGIRTDAGLSPTERIESGDIDSAAVQVSTWPQFWRLADNDVQKIIFVFVGTYGSGFFQSGLQSLVNTAQASIGMHMDGDRNAILITESSTVVFLPSTILKATELLALGGLR